MRRLLFAFLWIAVVLLVVQVVYFVFFSVRAPRYNEGRPLPVAIVPSSVPNVSALHHDGYGNVWVGTEGGGVHRFDSAKNEAQPVMVPKELKQAKIRSLAMDGQGRLWAGTARDGLFVRCGDEWKHFDVGRRIPVINVNDGRVFIATEKGLVAYDPQADAWVETGFHGKQPTALAFDAKGNVFVGTACNGIFLLNRDEAGNYTVSKHITAKRRFGPGSAPSVSPVPLDPCGEGLPSNQINALLVDSAHTIWAATAAGLAWSRDGGENWLFVRGRDYGDKMRGLLAGTPHGWKELSRARFGELFPEDDLALLQEGIGGVLWIGTRSLGCIAIKPEAFYRPILPKSDSPESQQKFLEEMAMNSVRFHGTKADQITAMAPLPDGKVLLASRLGPLEKMEYPGSLIDREATVSTEKAEPTTPFPAPYPVKSVEQEGTNEKIAYPHVIVQDDDYTTGNDWDEIYGKTYAFVGGGKDSPDRIVAFDESLCKIRLFVGFVGNRTRPLEQATLAQAHTHHAHGPDEPCDHSLNSWSCVGNAVPKTGDGQHLWCELKLTQPGRYGLSLYFVDPDAVPKKNAKTVEKPRDYLVEIFSEPPPSKTRIPRSDWQEPGKRADEWAAESPPLAVTRVLDFGDGVYKIFELVGPGTYLVKIDKNYSRKIDLCAVLVDRLDTNVQPMNVPDMEAGQTSDEIP